MKCTFCDEEGDRSTFIKGKSGAICPACTERIADIKKKTHAEEEKKSEETEEEFNLPTLSELKTQLDHKVIGQENAKKQVLIEFYKHYKGIQKRKNNIFLLGNSGVGKTHMVRSLSEIFQAPLIEFDATTFSETGYKGKDVSDIIEDAFMKVGEDPERLKESIIFIDEIDKILTTTSMEGVNKVQHSLLKMVEGMTFTFHSRDKKGKRALVTVDTADLQFVIAGACVGLEQVIQERHSPSKRIGFASTSNEGTEKHQEKNEVTTDDLIEFGFIPEFIGRFPLVVQLEDLTTDDYIRILSEGEHAVLTDYINVFHEENIQLEVDPSVLNMIAKEAQFGSLGVRGVQATLTKTLNTMLYDSLSNQEGYIVLNEDSFIRTNRTQKE